jgi:hypothetical protein
MAKITVKQTEISIITINESLYNPDFKPLKFEGFRKQAGLNAFTLSLQKWIETTNANCADVLNVALFGITARELIPLCRLDISSIIIQGL